MTGDGPRSAGEGMWVLSDVLPDGTYGVTVTVGEDVAFRLDRDKAIAYAAACVGTAMQAEHQVAVLRLLTERLKLDFHAAGLVVVRDLRTDREQEDAATSPIRLEPSIGREGGGPLAGSKFLPVVRVSVEGEELGCLEPDDIRDHAEGVLDALASAELDDRLFRYLTERVDIDAGKARAVVGSLAAYLVADDGRESEKG